MVTGGVLVLGRAARAALVTSGSPASFPPKVSSNGRTSTEQHRPFYHQAGTQPSVDDMEGSPPDPRVSRQSQGTRIQKSYRSWFYGRYATWHMSTMHMKSNGNRPFPTASSSKLSVNGVPLREVVARMSRCLGFRGIFKSVQRSRKSGRLSTSTTKYRSIKRRVFRNKSPPPPQIRGVGASSTAIRHALTAVKGGIAVR